ncbi:hypothetical protein DERP_003406 [Dermatophagoides pteronyssinus]|uniref:Uncharacterized protein n=1 Tax=Dermatophagoides pteronyssinus TaxID=6956 RepID=A0ABQ8JK69_DERPT|nr:hypothetical protein DERP_003406 [Dermatophagoides pteronyssinus]
MLRKKWFQDLFGNKKNGKKRFLQISVLYDCKYDENNPIKRQPKIFNNFKAFDDDYSKINLIIELI